MHSIGRRQDPVGRIKSAGSLECPAAGRRVGLHHTATVAFFHDCVYPSKWITTQTVWSMNLHVFYCLI